MGGVNEASKENALSSVDPHDALADLEAYSLVMRSAKVTGILRSPPGPERQPPQP